MNNFLEENIVEIIATMSFLVFILLILNLFLFVKFRKIKKLAYEFFSGKNGKDLENVIYGQKKAINNLEGQIKELFDGYEKIYKMAFKGVHKIGVVRYNPFNDIGGNQSFVVALLDGDKSGVVITSLHTRDGTRVFSKPIFKGKSIKNPLTEEEEKAIRIARSSKKGAVV